MPRKPLDANNPRRWMAFAQSDLRLAKKGHFPGIRLEGLCYLAQQAAEKAIKAVLMHRNIHFPKIHQIQALLEFLPADLAPPPHVRDAAELSDYAVEGRYPQNFEDVTPSEYSSAVKKSEAVVIWAQKIIRTIDESNEHPIAREPRTIYKTRPLAKRKVNPSRVLRARAGGRKG